MNPKMNNMFFNILVNVNLLIFNFLFNFLSFRFINPLEYCFLEIKRDPLLNENWKIKINKSIQEKFPIQTQIFITSKIRRFDVRNMQLPTLGSFSTQTNI